MRKRLSLGCKVHGDSDMPIQASDFRLATYLTTYADIITESMPRGKRFGRMTGAFNTPILST